MRCAVKLDVFPGKLLCELVVLIQLSMEAYRWIRFCQNLIQACKGMFEREGAETISCDNNEAM